MLRDKLFRDARDEIVLDKAVDVGRKVGEDGTARCRWRGDVDDARVEHAVESDDSVAVCAGRFSSGGNHIDVAGLYRRRASAGGWNCNSSEYRAATVPTFELKRAHNPL